MILIVFFRNWFITLCNIVSTVQLIRTRYEITLNIIQFNLSLKQLSISYFRGYFYPIVIIKGTRYWGSY
jgi:hypothetical protein